MVCVCPPEASKDHTYSTSNKLWYYSRKQTEVYGRQGFVYTLTMAAAYLCIRVTRVGCDASNRADASAAAAPCAKAIAERGLWVA